MNDDNKEILNGIQAQISSFDNKASILLSVVGIVFAIALSFLDVFHSDFFIKQINCFKIGYYIVFGAFILSTAVSIFSFAMVVLPRKHKPGTKYPNYYKDIVKMTKNELETTLKDYAEKSDLVLDQIKINSEICKKKHKWIFAGIILLIPFVLSIITLTFMTIFA